MSRKEIVPKGLKDKRRAKIGEGQKKEINRSPVDEFKKKDVRKQPPVTLINTGD